MNTTIIPKGAVLFKDEYQELIKKLVNELDLNDAIENNYNYYKENNPSFLNNLLRNTAKFCFSEVWLLRESMTESEWESINEILALGISAEISEEDLKNAKITIQQIEIKYLRIGKSNRLHDNLEYMNLYLEILFFVMEWKRNEAEETPFGILHAREKLYLLDLVLTNKLLDKKGSSTELEVAMSLITGIKIVSIGNPLKDRESWFNSYLNNSSGSIQDRITSLTKIKKALEKSIKKSDLIDDIDSAIDLFETTKREIEKKTADDKAEKRKAIKKG